MAEKKFLHRVQRKDRSLTNQLEEELTTNMGTVIWKINGEGIFRDEEGVLTMAEQDGSGVMLHAERPSIYCCTYSTTYG